MSLRPRRALRERRPAVPVIRARQIALSDMFLHLQIVLLSLTESVLPDAGALRPNVAVDRYQISNDSETFDVLLALVLGTRSNNVDSN